MKKLIINTVVFVCVYALLHVFVICMFGKKNLMYYKIGSIGHMYSRIKEIPLNNNPDILFLGSSRSYRGFDSRVFLKHGIKTFNLGSSNQTPKQTEVLLKKYLAEINPKMILFEVHPWGFLGDGIESTTDLISNDHIDIEICKLAIKSGNVKVMNTLIYGLYQEYVCNIKESFVEDRFKDGDMYISGGFVEKLDYSPFVGDTISEISINKKTKPVTIRSDQLRAFRRCMNIIKSENIPYVLVIAPSPQSFTLRRSISNIDDYNRVIHSYGKPIDFDAIIQLEDSCFYDERHLSQKGVLVFNESLIQMLDTIELEEYE